MKVLGIHIGHDSGVALIAHGALVADVAEERFTRVKHYSGIPYQALQYCLRENAGSINDIDIVALSSRYPVPQLNHLFAFRDGQMGKRSIPAQAADVYRKYFGGVQRKPPLYVKRLALPSTCRIVYVDHHLAHAASAYYSSGIDRNQRALVVTCDGAGDGWSLCIWRGEQGKLTPLKRFGTNGSLGWFYSNVTEALGWIHGDGEGKTMGLAPYGDFAQCRGCLDSFYPKYSAGELIEPHDFGNAYIWDERGSMEFHFDEADEIRKIVEKHGRENVAAEAQRILEEQLLDLISSWLSKEKTDILCTAGGVFLNVKLNQRLWYSGKVRRHWTYPNCGDSGLAFGSAAASFMGETGAHMPVIDNLYTGPSFSNEEIEVLLRQRNIGAAYVDDIECVAADLLFKNQIVGWFQGRMESGPRALGNRSILMSAAGIDNKATINARVKYREAFRPFCPSMPIEFAEQYLVRWRPEPFMITSFDTVANRRSHIPAVVHEDGTTRPQTVTRRSNERYWNLLQAYGQRSGDPVLLNTSMNIMGEPIVCNPREAIKCFFDSGLDALILGNYLLQKTQR